MTFEIKVHHYFPDQPVPAWVIGLQNSADRIERKLDTIMATQADIRAKLDALTANVAGFDTVIASLEQLLTNLTSIIADLRTKLSNADVPQALLDQVDALTTAITTQKEKISADVVANTPATT